MGRWDRVVGSLMALVYRGGRMSGSLKVAPVLSNLVANEIAPGTGIDPKVFWDSLTSILSDLTPRLRALLDKRDAIQKQIDDWHKAHKGAAFDPIAYKSFLSAIGYLLPEGP